MGEQPCVATIYDVAKAAGVNPSTVSRAFSRPGRVSSRTAERIHAVAAQLGYRTDELYRPQRALSTGAYCLAVSDVTNPVYFGIIRGAQAAAAEHEHTLLLADAQESEQVERDMLHRALPLVDGLVIGSSRLSDTHLRGLARNLPLVVLNRHVPGLPCVIPDNARGMRRAVEHLAELGHTRICYLAGPEASWADGARWRALREAVTDLDLADMRLGPYPPTVAGGAMAAAAVVQRGVKAVVAYNDLMAMGLMKTLVMAGAHVPEDVSVVGFDNVFAADLITPGLTTVAAPLVLLGETAVHNVHALASGAKPRLSEPVIVPVRLIVRRSTAPVARACRRHG